MQAKIVQVAGQEQYFSSFLQVFPFTGHLMARTEFSRMNQSFSLQQN